MTELRFFLQKSLTVLVLAMLLLVPARARADEESDDAEPQERHWYGWQTLLTDGAALATSVLTVVRPELGALPIGTYALGGPIVHATHDRWGMAAASLGMRVGLPLVTGTAGVVIAKGDSSGEFAGLGGIIGGVVGMGVGIVSAMAIDASAMSWEAAPHSSARTRMTTVPHASVTPNGAVDIGVQGTF